MRACVVAFTDTKTELFSLSQQGVTPAVITHCMRKTWNLIKRCLSVKPEAVKWPWFEVPAIGSSWTVC